MTQFTEIRVRGDDAVDFLQGQLTQNISAVSGDHCPLAAWCSPKGRVVAVLRLLTQADGIGMVLPAELGERVVRGLTLYRLRAAVEFAEAPADWRGLAVTAEADLGQLETAALLPARRRDAAVARNGVHAVCLDASRQFVEVYGTTAALAAAGLDFSAPLTGDDWAAARIIAGIADVTAAASEHYTPHMLNLDRLGAISFDKGCYTGQEVVARIQHLGAAKRRIAHYRSAVTPTPGVAVSHDGSDVGEIIAAAGGEVLALLPVELHGRPLLAHGTALVPVD